MKIKRYSGTDMRQVLRMVREEQGPDAVILSNRRVDGGVEIVAAVDYDEQALAAQAQQHEESATYERRAQPSKHDAPKSESPKHEAPPKYEAPRETRAQGQSERRAQSAQPAPVRDENLADMRREIQALRNLMEDQLSYFAWGEFGRQDPTRFALLKKLLRLGVNANLCRVLADNRGSVRDMDKGWKDALDDLTRRVPVRDDDILARGGVVALVGPTGVGKTTTVAKLAARYALRHGARHVALITTDNYRVGGHEQLRTYGRILNIPVRVAGDAVELGKAISDLSGHGLVLIDTAGMSQRDLRLAEQLSVIAEAQPHIRSYLVLAAGAHYNSLRQAARAFHRLDLDGCILTKLDESTCLGAALDVTIEERLPIAYVSDGQRVPEDIHLARADDLVARSVAIMEAQGMDVDQGLLPLTLGRKAVHAH